MSWEVRRGQERTGEVSIGQSRSGKIRGSQGRSGESRGGQKVSWDVSQCQGSPWEVKEGQGRSREFRGVPGLQCGEKSTHTHPFGVGKLSTKPSAIFCLCLTFQHVPGIFVHLSSSFLHYPKFSQVLTFLGV